MEKIVFWQDEAMQKIDPQLYYQKAEALAKGLISKKLNRRTQIRKFYDEVVRLDIRSRGINLNNPKGKKKWEDTLPLVYMLTAKAAYAEGRKLVSKSFSEFIRNSVEQIKEPPDLKVFATFFEAFMGFYTLHDPKN